MVVGQAGDLFPGLAHAGLDRFGRGVSCIHVRSLLIIPNDLGKSVEDTDHCMIPNPFDSRKEQCVPETRFFDALADKLRLASSSLRSQDTFFDRKNRVSSPRYLKVSL
jgi:hypothetical protein